MGKRGTPPAGDKRYRDVNKLEILVAIFDENIKVSITDTARMASCCKAYAGDVKAWVKAGKVGPVRYRTYTKGFSVRKPQGQERITVTVRCLICGDKFESESRYMRTCPLCLPKRNFYAGNAINEYASM